MGLVVGIAKVAEEITSCSNASYASKVSSILVMSWILEQPSLNITQSALSKFHLGIRGTVHGWFGCKSMGKWSLPRKLSVTSQVKSAKIWDEHNPKSMMEVVL